MLHHGQRRAQGGIRDGQEGKHHQGLLLRVIVLPLLLRTGLPRLQQERERRNREAHAAGDEVRGGHCRWQGWAVRFPRGHHCARARFETTPTDQTVMSVVGAPCK